MQNSSLDWNFGLTEEQQLQHQQQYQLEQQFQLQRHQQHQQRQQQPQQPQLSPQSQQSQQPCSPRTTVALYTPAQALTPFDGRDFSLNMGFDDSDDQDESEGYNSSSKIYPSFDPFHPQPPLSPPDPKQKRKAQNRAAQRAFRERRQVYVKQLEEKNREQYRNYVEITRRLHSEISQLRAAHDRLQVENNLLKSQASAFMANTAQAQRHHDNSAVWMPSSRSQDSPIFDTLPGAHPPATILPVAAKPEDPTHTCPQCRASIGPTAGDAQKVPSLVDMGLVDMGLYGSFPPMPEVAKMSHHEQATPKFADTLGIGMRMSRGKEARLKAWENVIEDARFDEMTGEQLRKEFKIIAKVEGVVSERDIPQRLRS